MLICMCPMLHMWRALVIEIPTANLYRTTIITNNETMSCTPNHSCWERRTRVDIRLIKTNSATRRSIAGVHLFWDTFNSRMGSSKSKWKCLSNDQKGAHQTQSTLTLFSRQEDVNKHPKRVSKRHDFKKIPQALNPFEFRCSLFSLLIENDSH